MGRGDFWRVGMKYLSAQYSKKETEEK